MIYSYLIRGTNFFLGFARGRGILGLRLQHAARAY
jgi:hypothetical protein